MIRTEIRKVAYFPANLSLLKHAYIEYTVIFHSIKNDNFLMKNCDVFLFFAQNIDRGYTLEPPH